MEVIGNSAVRHVMRLPIIICPVAIALQHGTDYKIGLDLSVCQCVRVWALSRAHFLIDFQQNWHRRKNPQK